MMTDSVDLAPDLLESGEEITTSTTSSHSTTSSLPSNTPPNNGVDPPSTSQSSTHTTSSSPLSSPSPSPSPPPSSPPSIVTTVITKTVTGPTTTSTSTEIEEPTSGLNNQINVTTNHVTMTSANISTSAERTSLTFFTTSTELGPTVPTFTNAAPTSTPSNPNLGLGSDVSRADNMGFFHNKSAVAGVFAVIGVMVAALLGFFIFVFCRRQRKKNQARWVEGLRPQSPGSQNQDDPFRDPGQTPPHMEQADTGVFPTYPSQGPGFSYHHMQVNPVQQNDRLIPFGTQTIPQHLRFIAPAAVPVTESQQQGNGKGSGPSPTFDRKKNLPPPPPSIAESSPSIYTIDLPTERDEGQMQDDASSQPVPQLPQFTFLAAPLPRRKISVGNSPPPRPPRSQLREVHSKPQLIGEHSITSPASDSPRERATQTYSKLPSPTFDSFLSDPPTTLTSDDDPRPISPTNTASTTGVGSIKRQGHDLLLSRKPLPDIRQRHESSASLRGPNFAF